MNVVCIRKHYRMIIYLLLSGILKSFHLIDLTEATNVYRTHTLSTGFSHILPTLLIAIQLIFGFHFQFDCNATFKLI